MTDTRVALVTGANKGIGREIAGQLAAAGLHVVVGARDLAAGEAAAAEVRAAGGQASAVRLDLTDPATIAAVADAVERDHGRLDVLVNNAGIISPGDGMPGVADPAAVRRTFDTNFFGTLAVTQALLPLVRKAAAGRIVMVSSGLGSLTLNADPGWDYAAVKLAGYNASKAALNMLTVQLAYELRDTAIKVNAADPGYTATDLNGHRGTQTVAEGAAAAVRLALLDADGPTGGFFDAAGPQRW